MDLSGHFLWAKGGMSWESSSFGAGTGGTVDLPQADFVASGSASYLGQILNPRRADQYLSTPGVGEDPKMPKMNRSNVTAPRFRSESSFSTSGEGLALAMVHSKDLKLCIIATLHHRKDPWPIRLLVARRDRKTPRIAGMGPNSSTSKSKPDWVPNSEK